MFPALLVQYKVHTIGMFRLLAVLNGSYTHLLRKFIYSIELLCTVDNLNIFRPTRLLISACMHQDDI